MAYIKDNCSGLINSDESLLNHLKGYVPKTRLAVAEVGLGLLYKIRYQPIRLGRPAVGLWALSCIDIHVIAVVPCCVTELFNWLSASARLEIVELVSKKAPQP